MHHWPGEHSSSYWYPHFRDYLRFYANALATC
jgi:endo-alpha-1,4-polygalactosaminidase (GH114 family)